MAILKGDIRVLAADGDSSPGSRGSASSQEDDEEPCARSGKEESDASETSDVDSGMESDEFDPMELGEPGSGLCQVGNQSCSIPLELYDVAHLGSVLSLETWNECLTEEERFALAEYLPDMDQETFGYTLRELLSGRNLHFGSPLDTFFNRLKGGLCDPRIVLYRRVSIFLQQREYYHCLCKYQNSMVRNLSRMKDALQNCPGYGIEERLQLLNVLRSQWSLSYEGNGDVGSDTDSESGELDEWYLNKRFKMGQQFVKPSMDSMPVGVGMAQDTVKFGKEYSKGVLKVAVSNVSAQENGGAGIRYLPASKCGVGSKNKKAIRHSSLPQQDKSVGHEDRAAKRTRHGSGGDLDDAEKGYMLAHGCIAGHRSTIAKSSLLKTGKKQDVQKRHDIDMYDEDPENYSTFAHPKKKNMNADQTVTVASFGRELPEQTKKARCYERDRVYPTAERAQSSKIYEETISSSHLVKSDDWNKKVKKSKAGIKLRAGKSRAGYDLNNKSEEPVLMQKGDMYIHADRRARTLRRKVNNNMTQHEDMGVEYSGAATMVSRSEETESNSSDQVEDDADINPLVRNFRHKIDDAVGNHSVISRPTFDSRKPKSLQKIDRKGYSDSLDVGDTHTPDVGSCPVKGKHGRSVRKGLTPNSSGKLTYSEKRQKGGFEVDHNSQQSLYSHEYHSGLMDEYEENLDGVSSLLGSKYPTNSQGNLMEVSDVHTIDTAHEISSMPLLECNSVFKKRKGKANNHYPSEPDVSQCLKSSPVQQIDGFTVSKKGKRKLDTETDSLTGISPDLVISEKGIGDTENKAKPHRKPFTLITPTIHTGFSFSIIHLLSAVRKAMITPNMDEQNNIEQVVNGSLLSHSIQNIDKHSSEIDGQNNLPFLTVQDIVDQVRSNPGDPCILETQEPLQDLVRGVLKIFSSKTAPLGAKGWKPLVLYEKSNRSWYWVGPVASTSSDNDNAEEETSSEAWEIPHKMLVKLVDAFSNWLKSGQETLQQIGSLPPPPTSLFSNVEGKERFKDIRAQKSLGTIISSSDEVRAYFRREEFLRYSVPDRAFSYTAADGKKSTVAPLRRGGGKPTSKARDHFMLKPSRPPHVTILCLVRDAAARLPGSIGTRADVCTLLKDSQYIVEGIPELKLNQIVSGALDRLHYERDPCVQFDNERKLWVYLHRDREEEDFEDDGTSSTKKWKRQKKDSSDHSDNAANDDNGVVTGGGFSTGLDNDYDLNVDTSSIRSAEKAEVVFEDMGPNMDNIDPLMDSSKSHGNWEGLGLNQSGNQLTCHENSTDEDFVDEHLVERGPFNFSTTIL